MLTLTVGENQERGAFVVEWVAHFVSDQMVRRPRLREEEADSLTGPIPREICVARPAIAAGQIGGPILR
ncbi:hypothetical protein GCM10010388_18560 [Streptomyces mauvecolor]